MRYNDCTFHVFLCMMTGFSMAFFLGLFRADAWTKTF